ncbi:MAG TPA: SAM-dependent methyltransferase [Candidatus Acidoferrum sp.]|nr:SAM-dependent methyltransferase [Candidatus Acidoferrum sp.]
MFRQFRSHRYLSELLQVNLFLPMKERTPSRTALRVALRRAAHQLLDDPNVLDDPLAVRIVGDAVQEIHQKPSLHRSRTGRHLRAFMVARSRYAEDQLSASVARGVEQYVVLGAGLDTSAFRSTASPDARIFEVDHPDTQAWKIACVQAAQIPIPPTLRFVPVDFERQNLPTELAVAGLRTNRPTFFSWLGVVPYLTRKAATQTFAFIGGFPPGSGVVFDYAVSPLSLGVLERLALEALSARVARIGEPLQLFFTPEDLDALLDGRGFRRIEQLAAKEINEQYFAHREDSLKVSGAADRIVSAWT